MQLQALPITQDFPGMSLFSALNKEAFPVEEYQPEEELIRWSIEEDYDLWAIYDGELFVGYMLALPYHTIAYLHFFAIDAKLRSQGYGSSALKLLRDLYPTQQHVLEIETLDDSAENSEQRRARRNFYLRNGFNKTGCFISYKGMSFEILCDSDAFDFGTYKAMMLESENELFHPEFHRLTGSEKPAI